MKKSTANPATKNSIGLCAGCYTIHVLIQRGLCAGCLAKQDLEDAENAYYSLPTEEARKENE